MWEVVDGYWFLSSSLVERHGKQDVLRNWGQLYWRIEGSSNFMRQSQISPRSWGAIEFRAHLFISLFFFSKFLNLEGSKFRKTILPEANWTSLLFKSAYFFKFFLGTSPMFFSWDKIWIWSWLLKVFNLVNLGLFIWAPTE